MENLAGLGMYLVALATMGGVYAILSLGLNVQWGYGGMFNLGIAGFFAVGAYATAILTAAPAAGHVGGFALPVPLGMVAAMVICGLIAWPIGKITLRLQADYLAIATIAVAEILRLLLKNEDWLTNGSLGVSRIPRPFAWLPHPWTEVAFLAMVAALVLGLFFLLERARRAPWGRILRALRDNDASAQAAGKDTAAYRLSAFVLGSAIMGLAGAVYAHYVRYISPDAFTPLMSTFIVWVMLVAGGSGNNIGAILGALAIWALWSLSEMLTSMLPLDWAMRAAYLRIFLIGLALQVILQTAPRGLFPERPPPQPRSGPRKDARREAHREAHREPPGA